MTPYDAAMAGVIVAGMVWGAFRGITWQLASIASLVLGYSVSHPLSAQLAPHFPGEPVVARALAMLTVYVAVSGGVFLTAWAVRATLRRMKFESFDRHLGMLLGGLEGALLGLVVTLFVVSLAPADAGADLRQPDRAGGRPVDVGARARCCPRRREASSPRSGRVRATRPWPRRTRRPLAPAPVEPGTRDAAAAPASLLGMIEEGENRLGKAIADGAAKGVRGAVAGGAR